MTLNYLRIQRNRHNEVWSEPQDSMRFQYFDAMSEGEQNGGAARRYKHSLWKTFSVLTKSGRGHEGEISIVWRIDFSRRTRNQLYYCHRSFIHRGQRRELECIYVCFLSGIDWPHDFSLTSVLCARPTHVLEIFGEVARNRYSYERSYTSTS